MEAIEVKTVQDHLRLMATFAKEMKQPALNGYYNLEDFVAKHGTHCITTPLPPTIQRGKLGDCYQNAAWLAIDNPTEYRYCEGYAFGIIPTMHAWVIDRQGHVIDNTWDAKTQRDYFGIVFKTMYLKKSLFTFKVYGLIDLWKFDYPLLSLDPIEWKDVDFYAKPH